MTFPGPQPFSPVRAAPELSACRGIRWPPSTAEVSFFHPAGPAGPFPTADRPGSGLACTPPPIFHAPTVKNIVYFDLETQKSADEVGGWHHISRMGMSVGVTYSTARGEYRIYAEADVDELIRDLQRAELIVGFNILRFDYEVLHGYTALDLRQLPTLDLLLSLQDQLQHRLSLDALVSATFGLEKTAEGLQALQWYKQGRLLEIAEYCCYDVKLTRMLHEYGQAHGYVYYHNRLGKKLKIPVRW